MSLERKGERGQKKIQTVVDLNLATVAAATAADQIMTNDYGQGKSDNLQSQQGSIYVADRPPRKSNTATKERCIKK